MGSFPTYSEGDDRSQPESRYFYLTRGMGEAETTGHVEPRSVAAEARRLKTPLIMSPKPLIYTFCTGPLSFPLNGS